MSSPSLSVVIPVLNERDALSGLLEEIEAAITPLGRSWEVVVVDDGSTDGTFELVEQLAADRPWLRGVRMRRNFGKSAALATGFARTRGKTVVTIDGDGQDDPADIPRLLKGLEQGADIVSGWKRDRRDPFSRRLASRIFNRMTSLFTGVDMHDMNCGFKAYRGECARSLEVYGEMHRFIPALAAQQGWTSTEVAVNHRPRRHGRSRFGLERYPRGALDLLTVVFIGRYENRPLHLFGGIGLASTVVGTLICAYLTVIWIGGESIGQRPLLFLGVLLIVVGIQLLTLGLLGQMLVLSRREQGGTRLDGPEVAQVVRPEGLPEPGSGNEPVARETTPSL